LLAGKGWYSISGGTINEMLADPDYHTQLVSAFLSLFSRFSRIFLSFLSHFSHFYQDTPDIYEILDATSDFWETAINVCDSCASEIITFFKA